MKRPEAGSLEQRSAPDIAVDGRRLRGVIPYGVESRALPGGWREVIEPGALNAAKLDDLVVTVDHAGIPLGRYGRPQEFGDVVAFLASERASYVTGVSVVVDGGALDGLLS